MSLREAVFHLDDESLPVKAKTKKARAGRKERLAPTGTRRRRREEKGESTEDPPQKKMRVTRLDEKGEVVVETFATTRVFFDMQIYLQEAMLLNMSPHDIARLCEAASIIHVRWDRFTLDERKEAETIKIFYENVCGGWDFWRRKFRKDFPDLYADAESSAPTVDTASEQGDARLLMYWRVRSYIRQFRVAEIDIMDASVAGDYDRVLRYLMMGVDVDTHDRYSRMTALYTASYADNPAIVRLLLKNGADPDIVSDGGSTALLEAVDYNSIEIVRMLLEGGADQTLKNSRQMTPYDLARYKIAKGEGSAAIAELLLEYGGIGSWKASHP